MLKNHLTYLWAINDQAEEWRTPEPHARARKLLQLCNWPKCFVPLFGDHLLFPVDDLWPTFCTIWISAFWILENWFWCSEFLLHLENVRLYFKKTGYLQFKNSEQKICCLKMHAYKTALKKNNCVKFQMFNIQVKKFQIQNQNQIQNYFKSHIIFSFVK